MALEREVGDEEELVPFATTLEVQEGDEVVPMSGTGALFVFGCNT